MEFFFQEVGKIPSAIFIFPSGYLKKLKTSIFTLKKMAKKIIFLSIYDLRSFKSLEGDRWVVIQLDLSFLLHCT